MEDGPSRMETMVVSCGMSRYKVQCLAQGALSKASLLGALHFSRSPIGRETEATRAEDMRWGHCETKRV